MLNEKDLCLIVYIYNSISSSGPVFRIHQSRQSDGVRTRIEVELLIRRNEDRLIRFQVEGPALNNDLGVAFDHPEKRFSSVRSDRPRAGSETENENVGLVGIGKKSFRSVADDLGPVPVDPILEVEGRLDSSDRI